MTARDLAAYSLAPLFRTLRRAAKRRQLRAIDEQLESLDKQVKNDLAAQRLLHGERAVVTFELSQL